MELSQLLPVEMNYSTGWTDNTVLPHANIADLHDCLELAVRDGYEETEGCLSPETDVSIENVSSWLEELGDPVIPDVSSSNELYLLLQGQLFCDTFCGDACTDEIIGVRESQPSSISENQIIPVKPTRRKQQIIPLRETLSDDAIHQQFASSSPLQYEFKREMTESDDDLQIVDVITSSPESRHSPAHRIHSECDERKEDTKARRKRGLSHVEKRDRKKESNRNASYRYRQRKKMEKDKFLQHANTVQKQLETMKDNYFQTAEELIRYIKHANLIRMV